MIKIKRLPGDQISIETFNGMISKETKSYHIDQVTFFFGHNDNFVEMNVDGLNYVQLNSIEIDDLKIGWNERHEFFFDKFLEEMVQEKTDWIIPPPKQIYRLKRKEQA